MSPDPPGSRVPPALPEQPELLPGMVRATVAASQAKARATRARKVAEAPVSEVDPVARVLVDLPLAHLDRPFDYAVPATMAEAAQPGVRVKVRFAGQDVDGYVVARAATSEHPGRLAPLRRVVSPEPVLAPQVAALTAELAERYAGTRSDVLRLAVPARHATTEKEPSPAPDAPARHDADAARAAWADHEHATAFLAHLAAGGSPRAVWGARPGTDWPLLLAHAAAATLAGGRGALLVVPDRRDVDRVDRALGEVLGPGHHVALTADSGPARRYRDFLAVSRGARRVVVGTRAAAFAPVHDLGLVAVWDDGDDLLAEPRAPYPHAREVLLLRSEREDAAALVGGFARTVEAAYLLRTGWARELVAPRAAVRAALTVTVAGATDLDVERDVHARAARMPRQVRDTVRDGLAAGPVLVQTPRTGYATSLACERCRTPARCGTCAGPLALSGPTAPPACRWCGTAAEAWACAECGHHGLRAPVLGDARTAEELGRAFPGVRVLTSSGDRVLAEVEDRPTIVVATPGAEPVARGGYAAVVLLDAWLALGRADLRTDEEALRRWSNAVGLVRPGGRALVVGDPAHPAVQALVRWDHGGFADRESAERQAAHLPPASRLATLSGDPGAVDDAVTLLDLPEGAEVLGPVETEEGSRVVVRVPRARGAALAHALGEVQRVRSSRKLDPVRIQVDPYSL
ncbi:primosome assembly protein PriA [Nocardioides dongkuii]|uniref:primosomal protein N' family DNA-binding protein n=1 Tax=Nocardioides dongkuii TaxID=2760089 RepID=UPI0015FE4AE8|nr:primosome assembly protein PriA [Nocardioides dongkuii]